MSVGIIPCYRSASDNANNSLHSLECPSMYIRLKQVGRFNIILKSFYDSGVERKHIRPEGRAEGKGEATWRSLRSNEQSGSGRDGGTPPPGYSFLLILIRHAGDAATR